MSHSPSLISRIGLGFAGAAGLYAVLLGVLLTPSMQRFALYANKFNTLFRDNLSNGESFGFSKNQVTPFNLSTPDGETLYAWHILPLDIYARNEALIRSESRPEGPVQDFTRTPAFQLLTSSQEAKVVISFHGNAGHLAQNLRPPTLRLLASQPNTHVFTLDYRGFGHSTGNPSEAGLITDAATLVNWVMDVAGIPADRILILGQSLGTAVAGAVGLRFASPGHGLLPPGPTGGLGARGKKKQTLFAGIVLVAPFASVPDLLLTYRIGGVLPILLPLRFFPTLGGMFTSRVVDTWKTAERLEAYYEAVGGLEDGGRVGSLQLVHARSDRDIPCRQTGLICRRMFAGEEEGCVDGSEGVGVVDVKREGRARVRFEIVEYGGHNKIITYTPLAVAVVRAIENLFE